MNGFYGSYDEHEGAEVPYDEFDSENDDYGGSLMTHYGDEDNVRYNAFSHMSCESSEDDYDKKGSCGDELFYLLS